MASINNTNAVALSEGSESLKRKAESDGGSILRVVSSYDFASSNHLVVSEEDYDTDYDSSDESVSTSDDEEETRIAKILVNAAFKKTLSPSTVSRLIETATERHRSKKARLNVNESPSGMEVELDETQAFKDWNMNNLAAYKPQDCLVSILSTHEKFEENVTAKSLIGSFFPISVPLYSPEAVQAVKDENLTNLQGYHEDGMILQSGSKQRETLLHIASRRGALSVVDFLLHTAKVSPKVCCSMGRTPLHEACCTSEPNFDMITMLLDACPDLLYITDSRGFTPLDYVPSLQWESWCMYLERRGADKLVSNGFP